MLRRPLLSALLAAALLAGCGGEEDLPQTRASFIAEADATCDRLAIEATDAGERDPKTPEQIQKANGVLADLYTKLGDELAELDLPPAKDGVEARAYIDAINRTDAPLAQLRDASDRFLAANAAKDKRDIVQAGTDVRAALDAFRAASAESDRLAIAYGMNSCGGIG